MISKRMVGDVFVPNGSQRDPNPRGDHEHAQVWALRGLRSEAFLPALEPSWCSRGHWRKKAPAALEQNATVGLRALCAAFLPSVLKKNSQN